MILTIDSCKHGIGKTTYLQQIVVPAVCEFLVDKCLYIDTRYEWKYICNSKFLKKKTTLPLCLMKSREMFLKAISQIYQRSYSVLIVDLSYKDRYMIPSLLNLWRKEVVVLNMVSKTRLQYKDRVLSCPDLSLVGEFVRRRRKTAVEIITEFNNSIESELLNQCYAIELFNSIKELRRMLDNGIISGV